MYTCVVVKVFTVSARSPYDLSGPVTQGGSHCTSSFLVQSPVWPVNGISVTVYMSATGFMGKTQTNYFEGVHARLLLMYAQFLTLF